MLIAHSNSFQTIHGLQYELTVWIDTVINERKRVLQYFNKLKFYIDNFKPLAEIDDSDRDKMQAFLHQASECHLDLEESEDRVFYSIHYNQSNVLR